MYLKPLKIWVQAVAPIVYDDSLSYYETLSKVTQKTNEVIEQVNENTEGIVTFILPSDGPFFR